MGNGRVLEPHARGGMRVFDVVADEAGGDWPIAAHVTHTSYKDMIALAKHAEEIGFDLLICAAPYFVTKTEDQVVEWMELLADNTNLAIMYYNSRSSVSL